jgi:hypothetical protein
MSKTPKPLVQSANARWAPRCSSSGSGEGRSSAPADRWWAPRGSRRAAARCPSRCRRPCARVAVRERCGGSPRHAVTHSSSVHRRLLDASHAASAWSREMYPCGSHPASTRRGRTGAAGVTYGEKGPSPSTSTSEASHGRCRSGRARAPCPRGTAALQVERAGEAEGKEPCARRRREQRRSTPRSPSALPARHGCGMRCVNHAAAPAAATTTSATTTPIFAPEPLLSGAMGSAGVARSAAGAGWAWRRERAPGPSAG